MNDEPRQPASRRAFTLLELLLVLVLIGISAATIVPHLNGTVGRWQLKESVKNLQAALQLASQWACVRQEPVVLTVDTRRGAFALKPLAKERLRGNHLLPVGWQSFGRGVKISEVQGFRSSGSRRSLTFHPNGTSPAARIVLTGSESGANQKTVWQITIDGHGGVQCQERLTDENALDR